MQIKTRLRFYLTPARIAVTKKINDNKCWHGCGERGPRSSLLVGVQTGAAAVEIRMESSQKLNKELCCNPDVALPGVYPGDLKLDHRNTCTFMFIATRFTIAKKWNQLRWLSTTNGKEKCDMCTQWDFIRL